jgi:signal transduction histidine kinase
MLGIRIGLAADLAGRGEPGEAVGHLTAAQELLARTSESVRDVMAELRPPVLDDLGLLPALEWLGRRQSQGNGALVRVDGDRSAPRLDRDTELTLLRIAEEAITNAITHAHAGSVEVSLARSPGRVRLTISDDGVGFDPAGPKAPGAEGHWGLTIMHERALAIGGTLAVDSRAGGGTRVTVVVPEAARGG